MYLVGTHFIKMKTYEMYTISIQMWVTDMKQVALLMLIFVFRSISTVDVGQTVKSISEPI